MRVLLIDDDADDRALVARELGRDFANLDSVEVTDAASFAAALEAGGYDLVVTDFRLRWTDGLQVLAALKAKFPDLPVLMFTATGNEEVAVAALQAGLDDYIIKSPKHLIRIRPAARAAMQKMAQQIALRDRDAQLRAIFENVVDGIVIVDDRGIIEAINPAAERLFDHSVQELVGRPVTVLLPKPLHQARDDYFLANEKTEAGKLAGLVREAMGRRRDGLPISLELSVSQMVLGGSNDQRRLFTVVVRDITERKRTEREIRAARDRAEAASRAKTEFLANMSHEFRTPLNAMIGFAEIIAAKTFGEDSVGRYADYAADIVRSGRNLVELLSDILDMANIDAGRYELSNDIVDIGDILQACLSMVKRDAVAAQLDLRVDVAPDLPRIRADRRAIKKTLVNLLSNAVRYNRPNGAVTVTTCLDYDHGLLVAISDTGVGMDQETLDRIFEPFQRGEIEAMKPGGVGLGLSIAKRLVEIHDGSLAVDSALAQGTTVTIRLPADRVLHAATEDQSQPTDPK